MTTTDLTSTSQAGTPVGDPDSRFVAWAAELGSEISAQAAEHDTEGTFVSEAYDLFRNRGFLALAVPEELCGSGASIRQVAMAQRELARHDASAALASVMHHHVTLFTAWRYRRGLPGAETTLRRVADEGIVLLSTGGADLTHPKGAAVRTDGGFLVSGEKHFVSASPVGDVMSTMFPYEDPDDGLVVLNVAVPMAADGVQVHDTWDAMGMRGTASGKVTITDVFVPDEKVLARRPHGVIDPPLQVILSIALSEITAVYLGVAEAARDHAVAGLAGTPKVEDPIVQRQVGLMDHRLRVATWALEGALRTVGDDPTPSMGTLVEVLAAKREVSLASVEVCDLAMEVAGGAGFLKGSRIERCYRDVRGLKLHPMSSEQVLVHAGRHALGQPTDTTP
jgi:alkylation response protein AidB-like acyl-CoA dehydrogenase